MAKAHKEALSKEALEAIGREVIDTVGDLIAELATDPERAGRDLQRIHAAVAKVHKARREEAKEPDWWAGATKYDLEREIHAHRRERLREDDTQTELRYMLVRAVHDGAHFRGLNQAPGGERVRWLIELHYPLLAKHLPREASELAVVDRAIVSALDVWLRKRGGRRTKGAHAITKDAAFKALGELLGLDRVSEKAWNASFVRHAKWLRQQQAERDANKERLALRQRELGKHPAKPKPI